VSVIEIIIDENNPLLLANLSAGHKSQLVESARPSKPLYLKESNMKRQTIRREVYFTVLVIEMHIMKSDSGQCQTRVLDVVMLRNNKMRKIEKVLGFI